MKQNETERNGSDSYLILNGKIFIRPPSVEGGFKELFQKAVAYGVGLPVDEAGLPVGVWTPERLAEAISMLEENRKGIDLRTVQLWFQDKDGGIGPVNIHWLARVFGCEDAEATKLWQTHLALAQRQSRTNRKKKSPAAKATGISGDATTLPNAAASISAARIDRKTSSDIEATKEERRNLAVWTSSLFNQSNYLNLASTFVIMALTLAFLAKFLGYGSASYMTSEAVWKQVGYIWAPNWTFTYIVLFPSFLLVLSTFVQNWFAETRPLLLAHPIKLETEVNPSWVKRITQYKYSFWVVIWTAATVTFCMQWTLMYLLPTFAGDPGQTPMHWGLMTTILPLEYSAATSLLLTFLAYAHTAICTFLFFAGQVLLFAMLEDLLGILTIKKTPGHLRDKAIYQIVECVFRCTVLGIAMAVVLKTQRFYLMSDASNILEWLHRDIQMIVDPSLWFVMKDVDVTLTTHFSSFVMVLLTTGIFIGAVLRLNYRLMPESGAAFSFNEAAALYYRLMVLAFLVGHYFTLAIYNGFSVAFVLSWLVTLHVLLRTKTRFGAQKGAYGVL